MIDDLDRKILRLLANNARLSVAVMARRLGVARSTLQARLDRMETTGVIAGYALRLGEEVRAGRIRATVMLSISPLGQAGIIARLKSVPEVERVVTVSGRVDLLLEVGAATPAALDAVLDRIGEIDGVRSSESLIHLTTRIDRAL